MKILFSIYKYLDIQNYIWVFFQKNNLIFVSTLVDMHKCVYMLALQLRIYIIYVILKSRFVFFYIAEYFKLF